MDQASGRMRPSQVIVVDDDPAVCNALEFALQLDGYDVKTFASAELLLAEPDPSPSSCLVLDLRLPGADGLELLAQLRARGVHAPAVLMTMSTSTVRRRAAAANVAIVEKPLMGSALAESIRGLIGDPP